MDYSTRYEICIGLNDGDTKQQKFPIEKYEEVVINVCKGYKVAYSVDELKGGYIHEDGTYVRENSVRILLIGASEELVNEIANDLCAFFNQESVLVMKSETQCYFVSNRIEK